MVSKRNDVVLELKLMLGCLVHDDNKLIIESLDDDRLNYGDGIVMLLEIISLQISFGIIIDLSALFNRIFLLR